MNTSLNADRQGSNNASPAKLVARVLIALCALLPVGVLASPTVSTAAAPTGTAQACFQASTNLAGRAYWGPFNSKPVRLDAYVNGAWHQIGQVQTDIRGCVRIPLPANNYWRFRVFHQLSNGAAWWGQTGHHYVRSGYVYDYGTLWLSTNT